MIGHQIQYWLENASSATDNYFSLIQTIPPIVEDWLNGLVPWSEQASPETHLLCRIQPLQSKSLVPGRARD